MAHRPAGAPPDTEMDGPPSRRDGSHFQLEYINNRVGNIIKVMAQMRSGDIVDDCGEQIIHNLYYILSLIGDAIRVDDCRPLLVIFRPRIDIINACINCPGCRLLAEEQVTGHTLDNSPTLHELSIEIARVDQLLLAYDSLVEEY